MDDKRKEQIEELENKVVELYLYIAGQTNELKRMQRKYVKMLHTINGMMDQIQNLKKDM